METEDAVVFIDAQLYIDLYRTESGKELLALLQEQQDYIFITEQIVKEVNKHKLPEAIGFFQRECQISKPPGSKLPNHLFDDDGSIVQRIRDKLKIASEKVKEATSDLEKAISETLRLISRSEDRVSTALAPLFSRGMVHKPEELERARVRNARGIPPGKKVGAVGDELTWEQFISFVKERGKRRLWIISRDRDYCLTHGKEAVFLVSTLYQEVQSLTNPPPAVYAFTNIPDAIKHFSKTTGVEASKLPIPARVEHIKKEQEKLPPLGWAQGTQGPVPSASMPSGSGSFYPTSSTTPYPAGYYQGSGSGYSSQTSTTVPPFDYYSGSGSGWGSDEQPEQLFVYWNDGEKSPMTFADGVWKGPFQRVTASGETVAVPSIEVREHEVIIDGTSYPIQSRFPMFADFAHKGEQI